MSPWHCSSLKSFDALDRSLAVAARYRTVAHLHFDVAHPLSAGRMPTNTCPSCARPPTQLGTWRASHKAVGYDLAGQLRSGLIPFSKTKSANPVVLRLNAHEAIPLPNPGGLVQTPQSKVPPPGSLGCARSSCARGTSDWVLAFLGPNPVWALSSSFLRVARHPAGAGKVANRGSSSAPIRCSRQQPPSHALLRRNPQWEDFPTCKSPLLQFGVGKEVCRYLFHKK